MNRCQEYYWKNRDKVLKKQRQHYKANKTKIAKRKKEYAEKNKELIANYYIKNKEHKKKYSRLYSKTLKGKLVLKANKHKRRLLTSDLDSKIVQKVYEDNIKKHGTLTCILCLKSVEFGKDSLEHKVPISRGGSNNYSNLGIAHRSCNSKKHTKTLDEWNNLKKV